MPSNFATKIAAVWLFFFTLMHCLMGLNYETKQIGIRPAFAIGEQVSSTTKPCYVSTGQKSERLRYVSKVADDGSIYLDTVEHVELAGIAIPKAGSADDKQDCSIQVIKFINAKLSNKGVYIYAAEDNVPRNDKPLKVYVITQNGEFFNQELVRMGLARANPRNSRNEPLICADNLITAERQARTKKTGLWIGDCLSNN
ncbi:MAG: thermonuclease family protein [Deltaproteobacteria bacterium]|nr:thermonuclease family protein [Deltaproteobacteria bacterium]